jgi:arylsulfatase A-like enzyme
MAPVLVARGCRSGQGAVPWAFAMDTLYRWVRQIASLLGGTLTGMVMTWPRRISDAGGIRNQFRHVIDVVPTMFDAVGIPQPTMVNAIAQRPWDRASRQADDGRAGEEAGSMKLHPNRR